MAKTKQKFSRDIRKPIKPPAFNFPAISVIIPLYNSERYIGDALDSLLAQTFQNFEVIVVDDCSTDSSCAIVENYAERFGGRLKLAHMKEQSGNGGYLPRNKGVKFSRGEYVYFMDSDDAVTPTALEELYTHAKNFDADVVQCEKYYEIPDDRWHDAAFRAQAKPFNYLTGEKIFVTAPLIWQDNFEERIKFFAQRKLIWNVWAQLIRHDFIIENELRMPNAVAQDMTFTICELCAAKKYVVVPNIINYYRQRRDSVVHKQVTPQKLLHKQIKALTSGVRYIDEFLSGREFFSRRPDLKYLLFDTLIQDTLMYLGGIYAKIPAPQLDALLRKEFVGEDSALTSFVFSTMNVQRLQLIMAQRRIAELEAALKARK